VQGSVPEGRGHPTDTEASRVWGQWAGAIDKMESD